MSDSIIEHQRVVLASEPQQVVLARTRTRSEVNSLHAKYVNFLAQTQKPGKDWGQKNRRFINEILVHACGWKGLCSPPSMETIASICKWKKMPFQLGCNKLFVFKLLVRKLTQEIQAYDSNYSLPVPTTASAKLLFDKTPIIMQSTAEAVHTVPIVGSKVFKSMAEYTRYVRVGNHPLHASPCVPSDKINWSQPIVYEEWHRHGTGRNTLQKKYWIHCRCRRRRHQPKSGTTGKERKRRLIKEEYVGTRCPARHTAYIENDGSICVIFRGVHNHDCQAKYAMNFINPLKVCQPLREMVDRTLFSGGAKPAHVAHTVRMKMRELRENDESFEQIRAFQMSLVLQPKHISYRLRQLGLKKNPKNSKSCVAGLEQKRSNNRKRKVTTPAAHVPKAKVRTTLSAETGNTQPSRTTPGRQVACLISHCLLCLIESAMILLYS